MLIAPSVTPWRARVTPTIIKQARNPALRVLQYNRRNGEITDIEQYYVDLTKANEEGRKENTKFDLGHLMVIITVRKPTHFCALH